MALPSSNAGDVDSLPLMGIGNRPEHSRALARIGQDSLPLMGDRKRRTTQRRARWSNSHYPSWGSETEKAGGSDTGATLTHYPSWGSETTYPCRSHRPHHQHLITPVPCNPSSQIWAAVDFARPPPSGKRKRLKQTSYEEYLRSDQSVDTIKDFNGQAAVSAYSFRHHLVLGRSSSRTRARSCLSSLGMQSRSPPDSS